LSDAKVYEPYIRAPLETATRFCEAVVLKCEVVAVKHTHFCEVVTLKSHLCEVVALNS
jgi:hypothetical protein